MSSTTSARTTLEQLPPELLLCVCEYLSTADTFFSFYGLNSRFSQIISDYGRQIVLSQIPFALFDYICKPILTEIGTQIRSLTLSNEWVGVLSKVFLGHFGDNMSSIFPNLKHLTLVAFISQSLALFLDCLDGFAELHELSIRGLFAEFDNANESETFLYRIFSSNNQRLHSIYFDNYSASFHVNTTNADIKFDNIATLRIELKTINDLHRLLTLLPRLRYLHTRLHDESLEIDKNRQEIPVPALKHFRLQSIRHWWIFSELESVLQRMPNLEQLSIDIDAYSDVTLTDGRKLFSLLSRFPLQSFQYFLRLHDSSFVDHQILLSTWQDFDQKFFCTKNDADDNLILCSSSFHFDDLVLPCPLAKNKVFNDSYASRVKLLHLYTVPNHISEIFSILPKCHRLRRLCLQIQKSRPSTPVQQVQSWTVPRLATMTIVNGSSIDLQDFRQLLQGLPDLYTLNIEDALVQLLLNDQSVWSSVKTITHLCTIVRSSEAFQAITSSIPELALLFPSLKYFYFWIEKSCESTESLIVSVLNHLTKWNGLIAFVTVGIVLRPETLTRGIRQWTLENSSLADQGGFVVDYFEQRFRLWL